MQTALDTRTLGKGLLDHAKTLVSIADRIDDAALLEEVTDAVGKLTSVLTNPAYARALQAEARAVRELQIIAETEIAG